MRLSFSSTAVLLASFAIDASAISSRSLAGKRRVVSSNGGITQWQQLQQEMPPTASRPNQDIPGPLRHHSADANRRRSLTQHKNYTYNNFWINEGCVPECPMGEFCGKDQECHTFGCENVYAYGNPEGIMLRDDSEDLTCVDFAPGELNREFLSGRVISVVDNDFPLAVSFSCQPGGTEDDEICPSVPMNRQCFARQDEVHYFECYEISPSTDLDAYFADYIVATASLENVTSNETGLAHSHFYTADATYGTQLSDIWVLGGIYESGMSSVGFNQTLASMSIFLIVAEGLATPFPDCRDEGCLTNEFCGRNLKCHTWDCENFYSYGPIEYTGHKQGDNAGPLECWVGAPATECEWPTVVECVCQYANTYYFIDFCTDDYFEERFLGHAYMSRRCEAIPNEDQSFECFDMNPSGTDFNTYFDGYLENTGNATCRNVTSSFDAQMSPWHTYRSSVGNNSYVDRTPGTSGRRSTVFDADRTRYAIHARLEGERPGEQPSAAPVFVMTWPSTVIGIAVAIMASHFTI